MLEPGDWVKVKPEHDIPPVFRNGKPTCGRVEEVRPDVVMVSVSIGGAAVDEHSQAVPYAPSALVLIEGKF